MIAMEFIFYRIRSIDIITEKDKRPSSTTHIHLNSQFLESSRSTCISCASALAATAKIIGASCYTAPSSERLGLQNIKSTAQLHNSPGHDNYAKGTDFDFAWSPPVE